MEDILSRPVFTDATKWVNHPVLGVPRKLHKIVFEISRLSKRSPFSDVEDLYKAHQLNTELASLEESGLRPHTSPKNVSLKGSPVDSEAELDPYGHMTELYMICCRILLLWITTSAMGSSSSDFPEIEMRNLISEAIQILRAIEASTAVSWTFLARWPLLILGHAVENEGDMEVVRIALDRTWVSLRCGDVKRTLELVENVWRNRRNKRSPKGLNSLLERGQAVKAL